jgi:uncharacterized iron-regulated membrane protein
MTTRRSQLRFRQLHRGLVPIMVLPLLLTSITGIVYQGVDLAGKGENFEWLLDIHKGEFGALNLETIYPFLNGLGLLFLLGTGTILWLQVRRRPNKRDI